MDGEKNDDDKALYLAWVLGEATCFSILVTKVSHKATLGNGGTLLDTRGQLWEKQGLPPAILGKNLGFLCWRFAHLMFVSQI